MSQRVLVGLAGLGEAPLVAVQVPQVDEGCGDVGCVARVSSRRQQPALDHVLELLLRRGRLTLQPILTQPRQRAVDIVLQKESQRLRIRAGHCLASRELSRQLLGLAEGLVTLPLQPVALLCRRGPTSLWRAVAGAADRRPECP